MTPLRLTTSYAYEFGLVEVLTRPISDLKPWEGLDLQADERARLGRALQAARVGGAPVTYLFVEGPIDEAVKRLGLSDDVCIRAIRAKVHELTNCGEIDDNGLVIEDSLRAKLRIISHWRINRSDRQRCPELGDVSDVGGDMMTPDEFMREALGRVMSFSDLMLIMTSPDHGLYGKPLAPGEIAHEARLRRVRDHAFDEARMLSDLMHKWAHENRGLS